MSQRVIDLSAPLENGVAADPSGYEMSIENMGHKGIIDQWARRYKGLARHHFLTQKPSRSRRSGPRRITQLRLLRGTTDRRWRTGKPSAKKTEVPLAWFLCPGRTLAVRRFRNADAVAMVDAGKSSAGINPTFELFAILAHQQRLRRAVSAARDRRLLWGRSGKYTPQEFATRGGATPQCTEGSAMPRSRRAQSLGAG
jgi:hypothetical protein